MINSISHLKPTTQSFNCQQYDISKKRTFINALDIVDDEVNKNNSKANDASKLLMFLPVGILGATAFGYSKLYPNFEKSSVVSKIPVLACFAALSALVTGLYVKKDANILYKSNILGQQNGLKQLDNPKSFLPLSDENLQKVENRDIYKYYKAKNHPKDYSVFTNFDILGHREFLKESKRETDSFKPTKNEQNEISNFVSDIDKKTQDYTQKTIAGMNIIFAIGTFACGGLLCTLDKIVKKCGRSKKMFPLKVAILAMTPLIPFFVMERAVDGNLYNNIEKISRYKAKEDFINNTQNDKNILETAIDYLKTKKEYKQKVRKQGMLAVLKNNALKSSESIATEIENAKNMQKSFVNAINSEQRMKNIKNDKLHKSICKNLIFGSLIFPLGILAIQITEKLNRRISKQQKKSILALYTLIASTFLANALLISNNKAKTTN